MDWEISQVWCRLVMSATGVSDYMATDDISHVYNYYHR